MTDRDGCTQNQHEWETHTDPQAPELDLFLMTDVFKSCPLMHGGTILHRFPCRESWKTNMFGVWLICSSHILTDPFAFLIFDTLTPCLLKDTLIPGHCLLVKYV